MNIFGIDLTLVPWPMFLLFVFLVVAYLFYLNIHVPLEQQRDSLLKDYEEIRSKENAGLDGVKHQIQILSTFVDSIKDNIHDSKINRDRIENVLRDVEKYSDSLNHISMFLSSKEAVIEDRINSIRDQLEDLTSMVEKINSRIESNRKSTSRRTENERS